MTKLQYKRATKRFNLLIIDWLDILPCYDLNGNPVNVTPVPIVMFPFKKLEELTKRISKTKFHFAWSTVHYYYIPEDYTTQALIKD